MEVNEPTTISVKKYPVIELKGKGKLIIPENVQKRIDMLHAQIGDIEWCGFITYDKEEGSINEPSTYVAKVKDIYPMNIGSHSYTETDNTATEILKMDERIPSYFGSRSGYCHTHHSMKAFFSGTDIQELHDNVDKYMGDSYYLSVIFAKDLDYKAKIVKLVNVPKNEVEFEEEGGLKHKLNFSPEQVMLMFDLDVVIERPEIVWNDDIMQTRIDELKAEAAAKAAEEAAKKATSHKEGFKYGKQAEMFNDEGWIKNENGHLVYVGKPKATFGIDKDNPYEKFSDQNLKMNLRRILEVSDNPTKEIGQSLIKATEMTSDQWDTYLDLLGDNMAPLTIAMFGEHRAIEGLHKTAKTLKSYMGAAKWRSEVELILEVFEQAIEILEEENAYELDELPEFKL